MQDQSRRDYLDLNRSVLEFDEHHPLQDDDYLDMATPVNTAREIRDPSEASEWTLEGLAAAIHAKNLKKIKEDSVEVYQQLGKLMSDNSQLRKLVGDINAATDDKGSVDLDTIAGLEQHLETMRQEGIELPAGMHGKQTPEKRMRLLENLKMAIDTNNIEINMCTNKSNNLHFTLQESYQWMRSHLKTLDETKRKIINNIPGR